jgi:hypothetical protein
VGVGSFVEGWIAALLLEDSLASLMAVARVQGQSVNEGFDV